MGSYGRGVFRGVLDRTDFGLAEAIDALQWLQKSTAPTYSAGIRDEIVL